MAVERSEEAIPAGLCQCGCGERTNLAKSTQSRTAKGEPYRFIVGHHRRVNVDPPNPSGLCECGCGERTELAEQTNLKYDLVKGQARRHISGHHRRTPGLHAPAQVAWEGSGIEYGLCLCGCGEATGVATKTRASRGQVKGQPQRYRAGHDNRQPLRPWSGDAAQTALIPWAAGFFEGEGSIAIRGPAGKHRRGQKACQMYICVGTTEPELLEPFKGFGGSIRCVGAPGPRCKTAYRWAATAVTAAAFLLAIEPHIVSERNRKRIALAIEFQSAKYQPGCSGLTATEIAREHAQWNAMKELNRRGTA